MQNKNIDLKNYIIGNTKSLKDYILLIRIYLRLFIIVSSIIFFLALVYSLVAPSIYKSTVTLKITERQQTILKSESLPEVSTTNSDRYIANEIEVIENFDTRERFAKALIDSFEISKDKNIYNLLRLSEKKKGINGHKTLNDISELLKGVIKAEQKSGLDVIEISAESTSPIEAAIIANTCAYQYKQLNLEGNRNNLTEMRMFLEKQNSEKLSELNNSEDTLMNFQKRGGIVALDAQSATLINQLAQLDAQRDAARIDLKTSDEVLNQYKNEVSKQDPQLALYLNAQTSQAYIDVLQKQIAELQTNRDLAVANKNSNLDVSSKVMKDYDKKITELKEKLGALINDIKAGAFASSPDQIKVLAQKLIEEKINNNSLSIKLNELQTIINKYERDFNRLPTTSIELAQYQRRKESNQQLYLLINQKYQEALINELSQPGNSTIIGIGRVPDRPAKPNRLFIILLGLILGPLFSFVYVVIKDYFDDTVKSPADIENNNISFLSWIPHSIHNINNYHNHDELLALYESDSPVSESFRAIKARILHSKDDDTFPKIILVTSPAEGEGKSFVSFNLAGNFAQSNKRTLLLDGDLRRPRIHTVMGVNKKPGLVDFLLQKAKLEEIIRKTRRENLSYITSGSIPSNPAELLESKMMHNFLNEMRDLFDVIIIDSAPIIAVIDAEILAKQVDGTILVVSADKTKHQLMMDSVAIINRNKAPFIGTVLNDFRYKNGYGYYYKYYYNYSSNGDGGKKHKAKV
jgi:capsular exopolysaccharide synthesis family protein